jgi:hypothetical protein
LGVDADDYRIGIHEDPPKWIRGLEEEEARVWHESGVAPFTKNNNGEKMSSFGRSAKKRLFADISTDNSSNRSTTHQSSTRKKKKVR